MSGEPARCRLYLVAPATPPADFASILDDVLRAADIACLRLPPLPEMEGIVRLAQSRGTAVVLDGAIELAAELGADGVHLLGLAGFDVARRRLGESAIIGVHCGSSRHAGMEAGEAGADYVSFLADLELVQWWAEVMVVPVVAELGDALESAADFVAAGADFIAAGDALWRQSARAIDLVRGLGTALA